MGVKRHIKRLLIGISKRNIFLRLIIRKCLNIYGKIRYILLSYISNKVEENIIIFESFMGRSYSDSPKAIYEEMLQNIHFKDFIYVWAFKDIEKYSYLKDNISSKTIIVKYGSKEYFKYYSKAKYFVSNSRIPERILKKKKQVYIQTWHGTPLKKLGYDIDVEGANALNTIKEIRNKYKEDAKRYTYILSPSKFCTEKLRSAFNLIELGKKDIIIEKGYPRNDFLYNCTEAEVKEIKEKFGIPNNKKVILYAPTWRDNEHTTGVGYTYDLHIDFEKMRENLQDEYVILFRTHYFISNSFDFENYKGFIFNLSDYDDINHLYVISDILITDYSSVFFDYANLRRSMLFYMYDLDYYKDKARGFYINLDELPGPISKTEEKLIENIQNIENMQEQYKEKYKRFNDKYNYLDDGQASNRVLKEIFGKRKE